MNTKQIAFSGLMLAVIFVLSTLEFLFASPAFLPPHVKPGLANIVTMYCVFHVGKAQAVYLNLTKSLFVFVMRGPMAGLLSLSGGLLSISVIILLSTLFDRRQGEKMSYASVSVAGACAHNLGQYAVVLLLMSIPMPFIVYYLPVLIISGAAMGLLTGTLLKVLLPAIQDKSQYCPKLREGGCNNGKWRNSNKNSRWR